MTIVLGFRCSDGIVIAADRQITAAGAFKYHEPKVSDEEFDTFDAVFAYAGSPGLAQEVHDKISSILRNTPLPENIIGSVRAMTEGILADMQRWYTDLDLQMLIGLNSWQEGVDLLKFDGKAIFAARNFEYLAFGESSLIRFLSDKLYSRTIDSNAGVDLAAYLIKKAEDYIDGCGGPIDIVVLEPAERGRKRFSQSYIQERITKIERQEDALSELLFHKPFSSI